MKKLVRYVGIATGLGMLLLLARHLPAVAVNPAKAEGLVSLSVLLLSWSLIHNTGVRVFRSETGIVLLYLFPVVFTVPCALLGYQKAPDGLILPEALGPLGVYLEFAALSVAFFFSNFGILKMPWPTWATLGTKK